MTPVRSASTSSGLYEFSAPLGSSSAKFGRRLPPPPPPHPTASTPLGLSSAVGLGSLRLPSTGARLALGSPRRSSANARLRLCSPRLSSAYSRLAFGSLRLSSAHPSPGLGSLRPSSAAAPEGRPWSWDCQLGRQLWRRCWSMSGSWCWSYWTRTGW